MTDIDTSNVVTTEIYDDPDTAETVTIVDGVEVSRTPPTTEKYNALFLKNKMNTAIDDNNTQILAYQTRLDQIADGKIDAQTGMNATVTTFPQAQAAIRQLATLINNMLTLMDEMVNVDRDQLKQLNALLRMTISRLDSVENT